MTHPRAHALAETGYAVLDDFVPISGEPWRDLEFVPWRSSGITRYAPLTSYAGAIECNGFWNHTPPRADRDGVWIPAQTQAAPELVALAQEARTAVGRCRVGELQPNTYADAVYNLHQDDNNRLNPTEEGWIVRAQHQLSDHPDSYLILRADRFDPSTEVRIPLHAGCRVIIDTERLWHAVWHPGPGPLSSLITSWTSGAALDEYIAAHGGRPQAAEVVFDQRMVDDAQVDLHRRLEERRRALTEFGQLFDPRS